ncbi:hypothetical protein Poly30_32880 [Planctomycetes bacterium Poly30]|uniref:Uncharacterized protein n=1 Tax=Saltatorellus ferox TaxID=2528018 RepID=A0A518EUI1_9BACT|nr:hypothetical protein Poly30_32880 [Planctomycetes bacterium Poly30]
MIFLTNQRPSLDPRSHGWGSRRAIGLFVAGSALAALGFGATRLFDGLSTTYEKDLIFDVTCSTSSTSETVKMEMIRDGEPADMSGRGGGGSTQSFELSYTDTVLAASDGAPTKVQREFESVGGDMEMEGRDGPVERSLESAFEGLTITLSQGDDGVEVEVTDGEAPDGDRLEGHALRLPLDGLLPKEAVEVGGEWEIEGTAFLAAMGVGAQAKLIDRPEREGGGGRGGEGGGGGRRGRGGWQRGGGGGGGAMLAGGDWEITATLTDETREVDGVACAVITIAAEVEGEPEAGGGGREGVESESSYSGEFEAELLFCMEEARPVMFEAKGSFELSTETSMDSERGSFEMSRVVETEMTASMKIEARKASDGE